jgi:hypothetical protein
MTNTITFNTSGSEKARFVANGNFLINTTTDAGFRLDVNGTARVQGGTNGTLNLVSNYFGIYTGTNGLSIANNGNTSELLRVFNSGNVLIQTGGTYTENTNFKLDVQGNLRVAGGTNGTIDMRSNYFGIYTGTSGLSISNNGNTSELLRVLNNGNVIIQNGGTFTDVASSILTLNSTTKGVLFPRMTTTQKNAISSPATGLVVYDTTLNKLSVYTGAAWETVTSS